VKRYERRSTKGFDAIQTAQLILMALRCFSRLQAKRGTLSVPIGEASAFAALIRCYRGFLFIRCAMPICGARILVLTVLVQLKGHDRIGKARTTMRHASPIVLELAY
jgi:hypothetical protein